MAILNQLGINQSLFLHLIIFIFAYVVLAKFLFGPYFRALEERDKRTKGGEDLAAELHKQADDLRTAYEQKARQVSSEVKTIFDEYRTDASKEVDGIVTRARADSQKLVEEARSRVTVEIADAERKLRDEIPGVIQTITTKLLPKS